MNIETIGSLTSSPVIRRHPSNPILTAADVPYESTLVYNAGVTKFQGQYVMVFRNDVYDNGEPRKFKYINLGLATSRDGVNWEVSPKPIIDRNFIGDDEVQRIYDPRLTVLDGRVVMCFAVDTLHGLRGGIARTDDFEHWEILCLTVPDNRNMVVFPEMVGGKFHRFERPFPVYSRGGKDRFDMWHSDSTDLRYWGNSHLVMAVENFPYANDKIGPGAPPVRTPKGWLAVIHTVDLDNARGKNGWEPTWKKSYCAGIVLLDLEKPWQVIGYSRQPLLVPETSYEVEGGMRNNVIFPGGMILEESGEVKIYYGAADTVECLAQADVGDLINMCQVGMVQNVEQSDSGNEAEKKKQKNDP
jgi:beta-1,4-mannooligosaccharide/beta-1,4-mannosyl-N-acetylglucosamine phosphorylase